MSQSLVQNWVLSWYSWGVKKTLSENLVLSLGLIVFFVGLAKGAHDIWAATLTYLLILALVIAVLILKTLGPKPPGLTITGALPILILFAALAVSFWSAINPSESWLELTDWSASILVFFLALNIFSQEKSLKKLVSILIPLFWIQAAVCIYAFLNSFWLERPGTLVNANILTAFIIFWPPILFHEVKSKFRPNKFIPWYELSGLLALLISLIIAGSILAWLLLVLFFPLFYGYKPFFKWVSEHKGLFLGCVAAALGFVAVVVFIKLSGVLATDPTRHQFARFNWWLTGFEMFKDHPLSGIGLGNYPSAFLAYRVGGGVHTLFPHSWFLGILFETGLVGLSAAIIFLGSAFYFIVKNSKQTLKRWPWILGLTLFILFTSINIGVEYLGPLLMVFLFLGIILSPIKTKKWKPPRLVIGLLVVLGLALIPHIVSPFMASQDVVYGGQKLSEGNFDEAIKSYQLGSQLDPRSWQSFQGWAAASFARYREKGAETDLYNTITLQQRAIDLNLLNAQLYWEMGSYLLWAQRKPEAMKFFEAAIRFHKTNKHYKELFEKLQ